jgi:hypothetical protein
MTTARLAPDRSVPYRTVLTYRTVRYYRKAETASPDSRDERKAGLKDVVGIVMTDVLKSRWTVIVAVVVVAITGFCVFRLHGLFGSNYTVTRPAADALENTGYNPKRVLFEVFGSPGSMATMNYLDEQAQPQRVNDARLPWSHMLTTNDPTLYADLRAQGDGTSIGCRITVNGVITDERVSNNVNGYIACLDKSA